MGPEVLQNKAGKRSDQFALALAYAELRLGRHPLGGLTQMQLWMLHLGDVKEFESFMHKGLSNALSAEERRVLLKALARNPMDRFASCKEFVAALRRSCAPPPLPSPPAPKFLLPLVLLVSLGSLAWLLYATWSSRPVSPPPLAEVDWKPEGWAPVDSTEKVNDQQGGRYYRKLKRTFGREEVVMVVVPNKSAGDPQTFYIMENKVWNDLYAVFDADPKAKELVEKYKNRPGCERLVKGNWRKGAISNKEPFLGVDGPRGRLPVFHVTVTEAHCFAEWMNGRLPSCEEWRKAIGLGEDPRKGPFDGDPDQKKDLAVALEADGPWPVEKGDRDLSIHLCRQMATNGKEWTRDLQDKPEAEIPLKEMLGELHVYMMGRAYHSQSPLTFAAMPAMSVRCTNDESDVSFRVVLEHWGPYNRPRPQGAAPSK
jgi:hypothetical protein